MIDKVLHSAFPGSGHSTAAAVILLPVLQAHVLALRAPVHKLLELCSCDAGPHIAPQNQHYIGPEQVLARPRHMRIECR